MSGETNLNTLIKSMSAKLHDGVFVFVTIPPDQTMPEVAPRMVFQEIEGTTLILLRTEAEAHSLPFEFPCRMITLNIHSSLEAVGFMARIATELAKHNMGVNPVSGFFHDHIFVPEGREQDAIDALERLSAGFH